VSNYSQEIDIKLDFHELVMFRICILLTD